MLEKIKKERKNWQENKKLKERLGKYVGDTEELSENILNESLAKFPTSPKILLFLPCQPM